MLHKLQERNGEIQQLQQLYLACAAGSGAVVLTDGPVGCGKTALLCSFAEWATEKGALFASATASPGERHDRLGLIEQLMTALRTAARSADLPAADDCAELAAAAAGGGRASRALLKRVSQLVTGLAEQAPVVLAVDDVHAADAESVACLRYLARRIDSSAVLLLLTGCAGHERELMSLHAETLHLSHSHRVRLTSLSTAGVHDRLVDRLGAEAGEGEDAEAWHRATGGNPLLINALLDDVRDTPADTPRTRPVPGPSFRRHYLLCLHRAGPIALAVARSLAILAAGDLALVGALLDEDTASVRRTVDDLIEAGLLADDAGFPEEAARSALLEDLPAAELAALRSRAAELLHRDGAPARVVAEQLPPARGIACPTWQSEVLRAAGHEAMAVGDAGPAVEHLRRAVELSEGTPAENATVTALAEAEWLVDPAAAARHLPRLARAAQTARVTSGEARAVAEQLLWNGEFAQADAVLRAAADRVSGARRELAPVRDWLHLVCPDIVTGARPGPAQAPSALFVRAAGLVSAGGDDAVADRILRGTRVDGPLPATLLLLACLIEDGRVTGADRWPERLLAEPGHGGVPVRRALLQTVAASTALRRGEIDEAAHLAGAGLFALTAPAWGIAIGAPLAMALRAATEAGDAAAARAALDLPVPAAMFGTPFALPYLYALGRFEVALGHTPDALHHFERCGELAVGWGLDGPGFVDWWQRGAVRLGRTPRAPRNRAGTTRRAPLPQLTDAERRVGALAAAGRTNREIAELLFVTVSTVEQHLTKIYRKLKVRRRSDLPDALAHFSGEVLHMVEESRV